MSPSPHNKISTELIIFSVFQSDLSIRENINNHDKIKNKLKKIGIPFKEIEGVYKNSKELSFVTIIKKGISDSKDIKDIAKEFNQECILSLGEIIVHGLRKATLQYINAEYRTAGKDIGYFRQRAKEIAQKEDCYTFDPVTGNYFIVEQDYTQAVRMRRLDNA